MSDRTADDRARYVVKLNLNGIEGLGVVIPWTFSPVRIFGRPSRSTG